MDGRQPEEVGVVDGDAGGGPPGPPYAVSLPLGDADDRRLRTLAAALGLTPEELAARWVRQRLDVEDAAFRARGGGADQLLRLVRAIEDVEPPE